MLARKTKSADLTPVRAALEAPVPANAAELAARADRARAALAAAEQAKADARTTAPEEARQAVAKARAALDNALVQRDVADRLGEDDGPTDEAIEALEDAFEQAKGRLANLESAGSAWDAEINRRRALLEAAIDDLNEATAPWRDAVEKAIDEQMSAAVAALGEARAALRALDPWRAPRAELFEPKVSGEGHYPCPSAVELPADARTFLNAKWAAHRRLLR